MIKVHAISQIGSYHIENNIVNQDSYCYKQIDERCCVAAVADGLGSEKHSDIASSLAATTAVNYCFDNINRSLKQDEILHIIKESFKKAYQSILDYVNDKKEDEYQFDTTLALAIYIDGTLYFGNSGDSGILVMTNDGIFTAVTTQQNDEYGYVFPLAAGEEYWEFGFKNNVARVLLATDGIYNTLFPYLLKKKEVNIYTALAKFYMDDIDGDKIDNYISSLKKEEVYDDKTLMVIGDDDIDINYQEDIYYQIPDWDKLKKEYDEEYFKLAYPDLYKEMHKEDKIEEDKEKDGQ